MTATDRLLRKLGKMVREPRLSEVSLAAVTLAAIIVYLPLRLTLGRGASAPVPVVSAELLAPSLTDREIDPEGKFFLPTPPYYRVPDGSTPAARNPFGYYKRPPKPTPTRVPSTPPPPPPTPPPPKPPTPTPTPKYEPPFELVGVGQTGGRPFAFLKHAEQGIYAALEGWVVEVRGSSGTSDRHQVRRIELDKVTLSPADDDREATLELKEADAGGRPSRRR